MAVTSLLLEDGVRATARPRLGAQAAGVPPTNAAAPSLSHSLSTSVLPLCAVALETEAAAESWPSGPEMSHGCSGSFLQETCIRSARGF